MLLAIAAMASAAAAQGDAGQPLAKADQGYVQCYEPNEAAKTCQSIGSYRRSADGSWENTALLLISRNQPLTLEVISTVTVRDGAVCGYLRAADLLKGTVRFGSEALPPDETATILSRMTTAMAPMLEKEICTRYVEGPAGLLAKGAVTGETTAIPEQRVKWVLPSEGYAVASAPAG